MDLYTFSLTLGGAGLGLMALSGLAAAHGYASGRGHAHGHPTAHGHAGGHHATHTGAAGPHGLGRGAPHGVQHGHAPTHGAHHGGHTHTGGQTQHAGLHGVGQHVWSLLSPRVLFSTLVGFGAAGLVLDGVVSGPVRFGAAVVSGLTFEALIVSPLWRFLFRFASTPALTLESSLFDEARATTRFDARGQGLVALELDGQVVQVLGTLRPEDRAAGRQVRAGDRLRVESVDSARNRCTVSYIGSGESGLGSS